VAAGRNRPRCGAVAFDDLRTAMELRMNVQGASTTRILRLPSGRAIPVLGQGTVRIGDRAAARRQEVAALRLGLDLGLHLIDTAEMYADGRAEEIVGEAIAGRREQVFLNSKVLPEHATRKGTIAACDRSLRRLNTDYLDLYLLHWREQVPLEATLEGLQALKQAGKIRDYGVSNFDVDDMAALDGLAGSDAVVTNQVFYNLSHRGIERDLLPWCRQRGLPVMAYAPFNEGKLATDAALLPIAARHGVHPAQIALAWLLRQGDLIVFPKASNQDHVRQNRRALDLKLTQDDLAELDRSYPAPRRKMPLETR
jgi:diketogulonate reductase-like aldo/keto reductase